ncbi:MAG TPA: hypothetical protein PK367_01130 [Candidatus Paceibacterota bacterium]|nr:hypothetical protein [Candidatus Paceibacterota bacterium]
MEPYEKIARILRTDKDVVLDVEERLGKMTGIKKVMQAICDENNKVIEDRLQILKLSRESSAKKVYDGLIKKIYRDDKNLMTLMGGPDFSCQGGCQIVADFVISIIENKKGFFLKKDRFIDFLEKTPPTKIMEALGYTSVKEMVSKEDWRELAAALRFVEGGDWINNVFLKSYNDLTPSDFEMRDFEIITLNKKWQDLGRKFVEKKYHNISHLKELGIIFMIPIALNIPGELIRTVGLLFHYINEVKFYSDIFRKIGGRPLDFVYNLTSLLRGDVPDDRKESADHSWMIVQQYLSKNDENDWRLFWPHVNPEAIHWEKAEQMIVDLGKKNDIMNGEFSFWEQLNWVGDYFPTNTGIDILVSFNLIDTSMSLIQEKEMIKYLYHHQEALWNKIFSMYFGDDKMEIMIKDGITRGYIDLSFI